MRLVLILGYLALALAPLALSASQGLPPRALLDELATGAGLVALAILLVEFVLSGRFRVIMRPFGMDITMRFHQLLARTALALVLIHPILYTTWQRPDALPNDPTRQSFVALELHGLLDGIYAFLLLGALIAMAILRSDLGYRYEIWRAMHGLGAVLVAWFGIQHATDLGRYSQSETLVWFWWVLFALAVLSLLFVYLAKPVAKLRKPWRIKSLNRTADRTWHVTLQPDGHTGISYQAGQFAWINLGHTPFGLAENPFSIASAPAAGPDLSFLIKELGDSTSQLGKLHPGTRAYVDAPHGSLTIANRPEPGIALIAGGVGLAPMMGILRELAATNDPRPAALVYGNRHAGQIACRDELESYAAKGTEITHVLSEPGPDWTGETGLISADLIRRLFDAPERRNWLFVLCGPPPMLDSVEDALLAIGVESHQILSERFVYD